RPPMSNTRPTGNAPPSAVGAGFCAVWLHPAAASSASAANARASFRPGIEVSGGYGPGACPAAPVVTASAARPVDLGAAHDHAAAALDLSVGPVGRSAADHSDGERLRNVFRDREQLRHGLERPRQVVLVEPGHDDALAHAREFLAHAHQRGPQELALVDADDLRLVRVLEHVHGLLDRAGGDAQLAVRDDGVLRVAVVDHRLEDLDPLAGDLGAAQAADQLLGLAAVHAADDHLDRAGAGEGAGGFAHGDGRRYARGEGGVNAGVARNQPCGSA